MVKNLPVMQETLVRSPGWEDPLEMGMATRSVLPGESMDREPRWATIHEAAKSQKRLSYSHYNI